MIFSGILPWNLISIHTTSQCGIINNMKLIIYAVILSLFSLNWLCFKLQLIPRYVTWFPELVSLLILPYIIFTAVRKKSFNFSFKYIVCILVFVLTMILSFILNSVSPGVMFSGMRIYLRYIPFFLLPAVWDISEKEFKRLLIFIFVLMCVQLPVVLYQRFIKYSSSLSGDPMGGTLGAFTSGVLSVLILLVLCVYIALYLKNRISFLPFIIGFFILFLPATMNETKITFVLLPFCFLIPSVVGKINLRKTARVFMLFLVMAVSMLVLKTVYDHFQVKRWGYGITTFMEKKNRLKNYADARLNPVYRTLEKISADPVFFLFGVGAGNASSSFSGEGMNGKYLQEMTQGRKVAAGVVILAWELGLVGLSTLFMLFLFILTDAIKLSKADNLYGALGLGMVSVTLMFGVTSLYFNLAQVKVINIVFWLFAGFVVRQVSLAAKRDNAPNEWAL